MVQHAESIGREQQTPKCKHKQESARYTQKHCMFCGDVISLYNSIATKSCLIRDPMSSVAHVKCSMVMPYRPTPPLEKVVADYKPYGFSLALESIDIGRALAHCMVWMLVCGVPTFDGATQSSAAHHTTRTPGCGCDGVASVYPPLW